MWWGLAYETVEDIHSADTEPSLDIMISLRHFRQILDKFLKSPTAGDSRVQVVLPNGEFYDIKGIELMQNKLVGVRESHRLVITIKPETWRMGKVLKKL